MRHWILAFMLLGCLMLSGARVTAGGVADGVAAAPVIHGTVRAMAVDTAGNRYVAGLFLDEQDFNPAVGIDAKTSLGDTDAFVTRFNANGAYAWTRTFGGTAADQATGVVVSGSVVYVTGNFASDDAGIGVAGNIASAGMDDVFVLALNTADGSAVQSFGTGGVVKFGGSLVDQATGITALGSTIYACGGFSSIDAKLDGTGNFFSTGATDAFVLALDSVSGDAKPSFGMAGVQTFGGDDNEVAFAALGAGKVLYVAGGAKFVSGGLGGKGNITGLGDFDAFVAALDPAKGTAAKGFGGIKLLGGSGIDGATSLALSGSTLYVAGTSNSDNMGVGTLGQAKATGNFDAFVAALETSTGAARKAFGIAGVAMFGGQDTDGATGVAVDAGHVYLAGNINSMDAGLGGPGEVASHGGKDGFLVSLDPATGFCNVGFATLGGTGTENVAAIALSGGKILLAGDLLSLEATFPGGATANGIGFYGYLLPLDPALLAVPALTSVDTDADGFPDDLELGLCAGAFNANSRPLNLAANDPGTLTISKFSMKLNFPTPNPKKDTLSVTGAFSLPLGFTVPGQRLIVYVGGVMQGFGFDAKGKVLKATNASLKFSAKKAPATFTASFKSGAFRDKFADETLTNVTIKNAMRTVRVMLLLPSNAYTKTVTVSYSATAGKTGSAALPK